MDQNIISRQSTLARRLVERLAPLAEGRRDPAKPGEQQIGSDIVTYCALTRERIVGVCTSAPLLGVVLLGEKQIWLGDMGHALYPGDAFIFPANITATAVNIPDERTGRYESMILRLTEPPPTMMRLAGSRVGRELKARLDLTEELVEAVAHAAQLRAGGSHLLAAHRLTEIMMLIADQPAAAPLFDASAASAVNGVVLGEPAREWTAADIGRRLGVGGSTLRRRLAQEGTSLRGIVRQARMSVAHQLLSSGTSTVSQAAEAAGYSSRSHFARAFRDAYGVEPRRAFPG